MPDTRRIQTFVHNTNTHERLPKVENANGASKQGLVGYTARHNDLTATSITLCHPFTVQPFNLTYQAFNTWGQSLREVPSLRCR